ncbi:MAG: glucoamylase family protein [Bythopirellula sp.]|nr:glucoamylase family protein [Bythopirellula sp.]
MFFNGFQTFVGLGFAVICTGAVSSSCIYAEDTPPITITRSETPAYEFSAGDEKLLDQIQRGCFNYLWKEVGVPAKLAKDRRFTAVASMAGVGFQLASLPIGVERGWITREQGEERALTILRSLRDAPENRRHGVFLHFVNADTGNIYRAWDNEISTVDHALFLAGAFPAASYFQGEVASIVEQFAKETNWKEYQRSDSGLLTFAWKPNDRSSIKGDGEYMELEWHLATDEERLIYFMAVGAPTEEWAVDPTSYYKLERQVGQLRDMQPFVMSWNGLLFTYFFSHCYINYRDMPADDPSQFGGTGPRVDWFENSRRGTLAHRQACLDLAAKYGTFAEDRWGLSPCMAQAGDKPGWDYIVQELQPNIRKNDDLKHGTVAPYAAGSSIMFTPQESMAALRAFRDLKGEDGQPLVWRDPQQGAYAFADSFNVDQQVACDDNIAIDVGPLILAIENVRSGLIWKLFMEHEHAQRASERLKLFPKP